MEHAGAAMDVLMIERIDGPFVPHTGTRPAPAAGELLVRIQASAVNPLDIKIRAGQAGHAHHPLPAVLGLDMAGVVEAVGPGVAGFAIGDQVFGITGGVGGIQGSLATHVAVDARLVAHKPEALSPREAAALPLVFITAWEGLVDRAGAGAGQTVLVHGGLGGVGHMAIQIARAHGARVFATGSACNLAAIAALGAEPIDYRAMPVETYVERHTGGAGFDIVYDTVGGANLDLSFTAIKRFGHVVSALGWGTHALAALSFKNGTYSGVFTLLPLLTGIGREHHGEILREAASMADKGTLRPIVDPRRFTLDMADEAHALMATGSARGKVVVEIGG